MPKVCVLPNALLVQLDLNLRDMIQHVLLLVGLPLLQVFCEVAYRATSVQNIVDGIDEFLDELIVLPPSIWDPSTRLEPPLTTLSKVRMSRRPS